MVRGIDCAQVVLVGCEPWLGSLGRYGGCRALVEIPSDLPDMTGGVGEAGAAHPPWPVHRPVEQHAVLSQLDTRRVHVIHEHGEHAP